MADYLSDQMTTLNTVGAHVGPKELGAPIRIVSFSKTMPTGGIVVNKTLSLCKIPAGYRIVGGKACCDDLGTAADVQIGVTGTAGKYGTITDATTAGNIELANTIALNYGNEITAETEILATNPASGSATWAAGKVIKGHFEVVKI